MGNLARAIANAVYNYSHGLVDNYDDLLTEIENDIDHVAVKIWREDNSVKLPVYAHEDDACMDIYVHSIEKMEDGRVIYHTGIHVALPENYEMEIRPRSSNTKTFSVLQNSPATVDSNYRGEILIVTRSMRYPLIPVPEYNVGDRVAQLLIRRREKIRWCEMKSLEQLGSTDRNTGGFGSTGK